ncbi:MAG: hypothetical protein SF339_13905 [Blastocatellia bacterium]|nr:hypothetical protein [Blastocatellia bacterium]
MNVTTFHAAPRLLACAIFFMLPWASTAAFAQREYTVVKPRERSATERVKIVPRAAQATKGTLAVVLNPVINGLVEIKDAAGRVLISQETGESGELQVPLQRGKIYQVEVSSPGYLKATARNKKALGISEVIRLTLVPQFVSVRLRNLPTGSQIFIDEKQKTTIGADGEARLVDIDPGSHTLVIRHPEHNDYTDRLENLQAGEEVSYGRITLTRVAKLRIEGPPNATVLIDGAVQGKIRADGSVLINYELDRATERAISVELLGFQTWTQKLTLAPGPRTIPVKLDPVVTSAGVTDFFENLSLWSKPASWKVVTEGRNKKLEVRGAQAGIIDNKTWRDFQVNFTIWFNDGKGATWVVRADKEGRSYYLFHLAGAASTAYTPKRFYTWLVKDSGAPIEVSTPIPVIPDLNPKGSYTINVTVQGNTIKHTITSNETGVTEDLGIWTDTSTDKDRFLFGSFGFRCLADEIFTVDDLSLEPIKP